MPLTIQGQLSSPSDSTVSQYPLRMSGVVEKSENITPRRSANYKASDWGHDFVQSLKSDYAVNVFKRFIMAEMMNTSSAFNDVEGMLSVFEASFYAFEGEEILDEAQKLTTKTLEEYMQSPPAKDEGANTCITGRLVRYALELPFQWITPRVEARWYIDTYEMMQDMDPLLLEFAKLDFNILQAKYQDEVKHISRWWKELGCIELLSFSRNRFVEMFVWTVWCNFEPEFDISREEITKFGALGTPVDDAYDLYGTLDELIMFTDAIERWDVNKIVDLPDYMKVLFLAVYNTTHNIAYMVLKKRGLDILAYLKKVWADFCNAYFLEAKWCYSGYTPTFEEYMDNGWISASGYMMPTYVYFLQGNEITKEALECLKNCSSDLHEQERGDTPKAIQCYMHQNGVSETIARERFKHMIHDLWKKMNGDEYSRSIFPLKIGMAVKQVISLIAKPIPIKKDSLT
ncbi:hypothetical protein MKW98_020456 [Papaver atlanticum]|uniref:Uncharacterized protein n=1 Tax=Papaver atlanticum TaxID=357466 RepID=A0AAD4RVM2_9MAGN|nr:hypothetical protein MKW98_020456 [Papaver atlanticum]